MQRTIISALLFCCLAGCSTDTTNDNSAETQAQKEQAERDRLFPQFQSYVESKYPGWKVDGFRTDATDAILLDDPTATGTYYFLSTSKDGVTTIRCVAVADFVSQDGTKTTKVFEPPPSYLRKPKKETSSETDQSDDDSN